MSNHLLGLILTLAVSYFAFTAARKRFRGYLMPAGIALLAFLVTPVILDQFTNFIKIKLN